MCRYVCICVFVYLCVGCVFVCGFVLWPSRRKLELYFLSPLSTVALSLSSLRNCLALFLTPRNPSRLVTLDKAHPRQCSNLCSRRS